MIVTFYSFKGGVGRTLALVNVGEALAQTGLRVLLIDFDLEAPSLESYYSENTDSILDSPGLLDLVVSYKRNIRSLRPPIQNSDSPLPFESIDSAMVKVRNEENGGSVCLISVGRRSGENINTYVDAVGELDLKDFYQNWEGELYVRWLMRQFRAHADVTLVDCRTGITDVGWICCGQMADTVVLFCSANLQQMSGYELMARRLCDPALSAMRAAPIKTIVVPAKIETSEAQMCEEFRTRFAKRFAGFLPENISVEEVWNALIPFASYNSSGTKVAVREDLMNPSDLAAAYRKLAAIVSRMAPKDTALFASHKDLLNSIRDCEEREKRSKSYERSFEKTPTDLFALRTTHNKY